MRPAEFERLVDRVFMYSPLPRAQVRRRLLALLLRRRRSTEQGAGLNGPQ